MFTWTQFWSSFWLISATGGTLSVNFYLSKILSDYVHLDTIQVKLLADLNNWRNTFGKFSSLYIIYNILRLCTGRSDHRIPGFLWNL